MRVWVCFEGCWTQCSDTSKHCNNEWAESYLLGKEWRENHLHWHRGKAWVEGGKHDSCLDFPLCLDGRVVLASLSVASGTTCRDFWGSGYSVQSPLPEHQHHWGWNAVVCCERLNAQSVTGSCDHSLTCLVGSRGQVLGRHCRVLRLYGNEW